MTLFFAHLLCHAAEVPPTSLALSSSTYTPPTTSSNTVVGALSAFDENLGDVLSFSVVGGADSVRFNISGSQLRLTFSGQRGTLQVVVRVTDSTGLFAEKMFTIVEG